MKVMRPNTFDPIWLEDGEEDDGLAANYTSNMDYVVASAVKAAYNEDAIYNQFVELQGTVIPRYYGLFVSQSVRTHPGLDAASEMLELRVMLLEDLEEQVNPHDFLDDEYSMKECQRIDRLYEKLPR
ncbi:hypothetical protein I302_101419 [Kwoniella bestiolae CBS 10118]|uniref:Uncharacterized protein n=1 Tax=Kwoniella bestiolae CBS 10118 TaxID=1296100 RepID=A0A1B9GC69_9TREE|nr:hypothetical protein I302_00101 [Kwoniella bestiolae CBS 10118]OCF28613.1 hypothetical protein I302_00101 [Kwoniella bestiolae CBS 10118]